jgi:molybdopterin-guanine dinucleotide biosynthesis protein A
MGVDKASVLFRGVALAERAARALESCVEIVRVVRRPGAEGGFSRPVLLDAHATRAPMVGIAAALRACEGAAVLVAACDQPELEPALLLGLLAAMPARGGPEIVAAAGPRGPEPFPAVYSRDLRDEIERRIEAGSLALHALLRERRTFLLPPDLVCALDPALRSFRNVNRPQDL